MVVADRKYCIGGKCIDYDELEKIVKEDLETHRVLLEMIKKYVDKIIFEVFGINAEELRRKDPSTYYAIVMELVRSEYINVSHYIRYKNSK